MDDRELERALTLGLIFLHDGDPYWVLGTKARLLGFELVSARSRAGSK